MDIWRKYNNAIIPAVPADHEITLTHDEIKLAIKKKKVLFARWTTNFDSNIKTNFWYVINDVTVNIQDYSVNTRSKIRRGMKHLDVRKMSKNEVLLKGYTVYKASFRRYKSFTKPICFESFQKMTLNLGKECEFWGVYLKSKDKLVAYSQNKLFQKSCEYDEIRFHPDYLHLYTSYALFFTMNKYYLNTKKLEYVNDGARSIAHNTNIQQFLIDKFMFRKAFCNLHIIYSYKLEILVRFLFLFRNIINKINVNFFLKLNVLLEQEKIARSFYDR